MVTKKAQFREAALRVVGALRFSELANLSNKKSKLVSHAEFPSLFDEETTLSSIIKDGKSIARFGDGELRLAFLQGSTVYENMSLRKSRLLREVLLNSHGNLLIGFNRKFVSSPSWQILNRPNVAHKLPSEILSLRAKDDVLVLNRADQQLELIKYLNHLNRFYPRIRYGEASVFRSEIFVQSYVDNRLLYLRDELRNFFRYKSILLVAPGSQNKFSSDLKESFSVGEWKCRKLTHLSITEINTFDSIDDIFRQIGERLVGHDLVMIKAGATATILASWISERFSIQTLDIGNFNWHLI